MKKIILILIIIHCSLLLAEAQWYTQQSGTTNPLYDIEFINRNTGWACGDDGIIKTTNGGVNWLRQINGVPFEPLFGIHPVDSNIVYAVGFFRTFIKTTNGGMSWFSLDSGTFGDGTYQSVFFLNEMIGWAGFGDGTFFGVRKTSDGGKTFENYYAGVFKDIYFKDSVNGIGTNASPYIFRSINGGLNWIVNQIAPSGDFYRMSFINENTGYISSHRAVYKTTNFGLSWDSVGNIPAIVTSISFINDSIGFAGTSFSILKTINGGKTWIPQVSTGVVYNIESVYDSLVWTCGNAGRIWHTTNGGTSFINNISNSLPGSFNLYQNYPNPFNSTTKIKFEINQKENYKLEIFNSLGQKIEDIHNGNLNPGQYEIVYDAKELNSGIYFYKLSGENLMETKKFVLIK